MGPFITWHSKVLGQGALETLNEQYEMALGINVKERTITEMNQK